MSDELNPTPDPDQPEDADIVAEVEELTKPEADKDRDKVKNALIATKRELRVVTRKMKELEPVAAESQALKERLDAAQPFIDVLVNDATLRAQAIRRSRGEVDPIKPEADAEAIEYAEMHGLYQPDGSTPDAQKARKMINWHDTRSRKQHEEAMRPLAGAFMSSRAEQTLREIISATDPDGVPWATEQSIREVVADFGTEASRLMADPRIGQVVLNQAAGRDRMNRRTPKPPDEPLFLDSPHGRRRSEPVVDSALKATLDKLGLSEKEFHESGQQLEAASRRGRI